MTLPQTPENPAPGALRDALKRISFPLAVFSGCFAIGVVVLGFVINPDRFPVRVGDKVIRFADLVAEEKSLTEKEAQLTSEGSRQQSQAPTPVLHLIAQLRSAFVHSGDALTTVHAVQRGFALEDTEAVHIDRIYVDGAAGTLRVAGDVRNVGDRSIQILAAFVDSLRGTKAFAAVSEPEYVQVTAADGSRVSPFVLTLTPHVR